MVIPVRNGGPRFADCLASLVPGLVAGLIGDVVVVDGASCDGSATLASDMGARVLQSTPGRGAQIATGIVTAKRDWLLVLHADSCLSDGWQDAVSRHIQAHGRDYAGWFKLAFDERHSAASRVASLANWRAQSFGLPYGDQGLLIHKALLADVGGIAPLPLMEDVDLVRRLGKARLSQLDATIETSADRYRRGGWWFVPVRNLMLLGFFLAGVSPQRLARLYR